MAQNKRQFNCECSLKSIHDTEYRNKYSVRLDFEGVVMPGIGKASFFMAKNGYRKQFSSLLGHVPFPGTLNVKIDAGTRRKIIGIFDELESHKIDGFSEYGKSYGWVKCYDVILNNEIPGHVIQLEKTHHDLSIIEIISKYNIRKYARVHNGSDVCISILDNIKDHKESGIKLI